MRAPDINRSEAEYTVERTDDGYAVRYALAGIRNVGEKAMDAVVEERRKAGPFDSLEDLFRRMPPRRALRAGGGRFRPARAEPGEGAGQR